MFHSFIQLLLAVAYLTAATAIPAIPSRDSLDVSDLTLPAIGTPNGIIPALTEADSQQPLFDDESEQMLLDDKAVMTETVAIVTLRARNKDQPLVPHTESTATFLDGPEPATTTTSSPTTYYTKDNVQPVNTAVTTTQQQQQQQPATPTPGVVHTEATATDLQVPTYAAQTTSSTNAPAPAYDQIQPTTTTQPGNYAGNNAAPTNGPAVWTSADNTQALAPGSSVVVAGTTYSLAAGRSALYVNGVSTSVKPSGAAVPWSTSAAPAWSTSKAAAASSSMAISSATSSATTSAVQVLASSTTLKAVVSASKTTSAIKVVAASSTAASGSLATGAAAALVASHAGTGVGVVAAVLGCLLL